MTNAELNIKCAEAMGWKYEKFGPLIQDYRWTNPKGVVTHCNPPSFTTDHNAAFTLVEKMREEGWLFEMRDGRDKTWEAEFTREPNDSTLPDNIGTREGIRVEIHYGAGYTAPVAICLALLAAKEKEGK